MSYPRAPLLIKGALVEFSERFLGPIPNVIVFQYNPETLSRTLTAHTPEPGGGDGEDGEAPEPGTAAPFDPQETFTLPLELDATDALEKPESHPVAVISGVADRIAALEMLMYPQEGSLLGDLFASVSVSLGGASASAEAEAEPVPRGQVPVVLFVWGPGRIVPVRLTSFSVEEQAYNPILYPIRAKVNVGLKILSPADLESYPDGFAKDVAIASYEFTKTQKQVLAMANLANAVESIVGMLPL